MENYIVTYYGHIMKAGSPSIAVKICQRMEKMYGKSVQAPTIVAKDAESARKLVEYQHKHKTNY